MAAIDKQLIKTWFVTGAYSGVGLELCHQLLERGYHVVACSRRKPVFQHPNALNLSLDVTDPAAVEAAVNSAIARFGRVDVLCNNAGISAKCTIEEETLERMKQVMEANFFGTFNTMHALLPHFRKNGHGTIINNTSGAGLLPRPYGAAYVPSKYAAEGLTDMCRSETAAFCRTMAFELGAFWGTDISAMASTRTNDTGIPEYADSRRLYPLKKQTINVLPIAMRQLIDAVEQEEIPAHMPLGAITSAANRAFELSRDAKRAQKHYSLCSLAPAKLWALPRSVVYPRHERPQYVGLLPYADSSAPAASALTLFALYQALNRLGATPAIVNNLPGLPFKTPAEQIPLFERTGVAHTKAFGHWHTLNMAVNVCHSLLIWQNRPLQQDETLFNTYFASEGNPVHLLRENAPACAADSAWDSVQTACALNTLCLLTAEEWTAALPAEHTDSSETCVVCLADAALLQQTETLLPAGYNILNPTDTPDAWLCGLHAATGVVTDSAAAAALALLWRKPFLYIGNDAAVRHRLAAAGLSSCIGSPSSLNGELLKTPLDVSCVVAAVKELRAEAEACLGTAMQPAATAREKRAARHKRILRRMVRQQYKYLVKGTLAYIMKRTLAVLLPFRGEQLKIGAGRAKQRAQAARLWLTARV